MTRPEAIVLTIGLVGIVVAYVLVGRKRWGLVREGWCEDISYRDWTRFSGVCPYTYDDLYTDETDTDFHFKDGKFTLGSKVVKHDIVLPAHIRLEANWLGSYRVVAVLEVEKAA